MNVPKWLVSMGFSYLIEQILKKFRDIHYSTLTSLPLFVFLVPTKMSSINKAAQILPFSWFSSQQIWMKIASVVIDNTFKTRGSRNKPPYSRPPLVFFFYCNTSHKNELHQQGSADIAILLVLFPTDMNENCKRCHR